jgi:Amiloride-sensitive sodium channel
MFVLLIFETTEKFLAGQILTKLSKQQHSVGEFPFPAVSVCPDPRVPSNFSEMLESSSKSE